MILILSPPIIRPEKRKTMKTLGVILMIAGALTGLIAWFGYHNMGFGIGGAVFFGIGLIVYLKP